MRASQLVQSVGLTLAALLCQAPAQALDLAGEAIQGGLMFGSCAPGCRVTLDNTEILVSPDGRFVAATFSHDLAFRPLRALLPRQTEELRLLGLDGRELATLESSLWHTNHSPDWSR